MNPRGCFEYLESDLHTPNAPLLSRPIYANFLLTHKSRSASTVCILYKLLSPSKLLTGAVNASTTQEQQIRVQKWIVQKLIWKFLEFSGTANRRQLVLSLSSLTSSSQPLLPSQVQPIIRGGLGRGRTKCTKLWCSSSQRTGGGTSLSINRGWFSATAPAT